MKKITLFILTIFYLNNINYAQYNFNQYFDGADTSAQNSIIITIDTSSSNIWQVGKPQKAIFDSAATFPNALVTDTVNPYPINNTSSFMIGFHNPAWGSSLSQIIALQWNQKLDIAIGNDIGVIEYSIDTGNTWHNAFDNSNVYNFFGFNPKNKDTLSNGMVGFTGTDSVWKNIWLCFRSYYLTDTIIFKFTFISDSVNSINEGWMIDNFMAHFTFTHPVEEHNFSKTYNIYPNPAKDIITLESRNKKENMNIQSMQLINIEGKVLQEWETISSAQIQIIDISLYPAGLYFLKIHSKNKSEIEKIPFSIMRR